VIVGRGVLCLAVVVSGLFVQFGGEMSIQMKEAYAVFCSRHLEAVRIYKDLLKTDRKFQNFIAVSNDFNISDILYIIM